jgi:hypothetical protein
MFQESRFITSNCKNLIKIYSLRLWTGILGIFLSQMWLILPVGLRVKYCHFLMVIFKNLPLENPFENSSGKPHKNPLKNPTKFSLFSSKRFVQKSQQHHQDSSKKIQRCQNRQTNSPIHVSIKIPNIISVMPCK